MLLLGMEIAHQRIQRWIDRKRTNSWLDLSNLRLRELPELPPNVRRLNISQNKLTNLSGLPRGLRKLYCNMNNKLLQFPVDMPPALIHVSCIGCFRLQSIDNLPDSIKYIDMSHCESLVEILKFPDELRNFSFCHAYRLSYIREFPQHLLTLFILEAPVYDLPPFPDSLISLSAVHVSFQMKGKFPPKLQFLDMLGDHIKTYVQPGVDILDLLPQTILYLNLQCMHACWSCDYIKIRLPRIEYYRCDDYRKYIGVEPTNISKYLYPRK
jgi:hypothetical protein